jgi:hypothetical protein
LAAFLFTSRVFPDLNRLEIDADCGISVSGRVESHTGARLLGFQNLLSVECARSIECIYRITAVFSALEDHSFSSHLLPNRRRIAARR